jgi:hypothetical protein
MTRPLATSHDSDSSDAALVHATIQGDRGALEQLEGQKACIAGRTEFVHTTKILRWLERAAFTSTWPRTARIRMPRSRFWRPTLTQVPESWGEARPELAIPPGTSRLWHPTYPNARPQRTQQRTQRTWLVRDTPKLYSWPESK